MEGFADLGVAPSRQVQEIKHVVVRDGAIRVHEAGVHIQQLDVGQFGEGGFEQVVHLGILLPQRVWLLSARQQALTQERGSEELSHSNDFPANASILSGLRVPVTEGSHCFNRSIQI